jgi:iron-sulfur cluster repair protein YtfE (RIC family)
MPVQIGAKAHNFTDPSGLLSDCHRRVEMFLGMLETVGEFMDQPPTEETSRSLQSALQYFGEAAPKHTADEEDSLFPRLRQLNHPEIHSAFSALDKLECDHRQAISLHDKMERLAAQYLSTGCPQ